MTRLGAYARWLHLVVAVVASSALLLQLWLVLILDSTIPVGQRVVRFFSYFTIDSNLLVAATSWLLVAAPARDGRAFRVFRLMGLVGILVTGVVYATALAGLHELADWDKVADAGLHYLTPVLATLVWLAVGPRPRIDRRTAWWSGAFPVAWMTWTLTKGPFDDDFYPYPFVDVASKGYGTVALNSVVVAGVFAAIVWLYQLLDRRLAPAPTI